MRTVTRTRDAYGDCIQVTWNPPYSNRDGWVNEVRWAALAPGAADAIEDWVKAHPNASAFTMFEDVTHEVLEARNEQ